MNVGSILSFFTVQRLYRFIVKRLLGSYLRKYGSGELRLDQLDVQLLAGEIKLFDLDLDPAALSAHLTSSNLEVTSATVARVRILIPWRNLFGERCRVYIEGMRIDSTPLTTSVSRPSTPTVDEPVAQSEGVNLLTSLVQQVLLNIELLVKDAVVALKVPLSQSYQEIRCEVGQALVHSVATLDKSISVQGLKLRLAEDTTSMLEIPGGVSLNLDLTTFTLSGALEEVLMHLWRPEQAAAIIQAARLVKGEEYSELMFHSVMSESPPVPPSPGRKPFWYEESDLFSFMAEELQEKETQGDSIEPSQFAALPSSSFTADLKVGSIELRLSAEGIDDNEARLVIYNLRWTDQLRLGRVSLGVRTVTRRQASNAMWVSVIEQGSDCGDSFSSAESSPDLTSEASKSTVKSVSSLGEPIPEPDGEAESLEGQFFAGSLATLPAIPAVDSIDVYGSEASLLDLCPDEADGDVVVINLGSGIDVISKVAFHLDAADLALFAALVGYALSIQLPPPRSEDYSAVDVLLPFPVTLRRGIQVTITFDEGAGSARFSAADVQLVAGQLLLPTIVYDEGIKAVNARLAMYRRNSHALGLQLERQKPRTDAEKPAAPEQDEWTHILGPNKRPVKVVKEAAKPERKDVAKPKCRVSEAAVLDVSVSIDDVSVDCTAAELFSLQVVLAAFSDRLNAATTVYSSRLPVSIVHLPAGGVAVVPPRIAVHVKVASGRVSDFLKVNDLEVRMVSLLHESSPVPIYCTQLGLGLRSLSISDGIREVCASRPVVATKDRFAGLLDSNCPLEDTVRVYLYQLPRRGSGLAQFFTMVYSVDVGGLVLDGDPHLVTDFFPNRIVKYFAPDDAQAMPQPSPLTPKAFSFFTVKVHDVVFALSTASGSAALFLKQLESSSGSTMSVQGQLPVLATGVSFTIGAVDTLVGATADSIFSALSQATDLEVGFSDSGLAKILLIDGLNGSVKVKQSGEFEVKLKLGSMNLEFCADSLFHTQKVIDDLRGSAAQLGVFNSPQPRKSPVAKRPVSTFSVEEDFVRSFAPSLYSASQGSAKAASVTKADARWFVDPKSVAVLQDHLLGSDASKKFKRLRAFQGSGCSAVEVESTSSCSVSVGSCSVAIFEGDDWPVSLLGRSQSRSNRRKKSSVTLELSKLQGEFDKGTEGYTTLSRFTVSAQELNIVDSVSNSVFQFLLSRLRENNSPVQHLFLSVDIAKEGDAEAVSAADIGLPPLCVTVDQDTIEFISGFLRRFSSMGYSTVAEDAEDSIEVDSPPELAVTSELGIQSFTVSSVAIEVNYRAKRVSVAGLRRGDPLEFLNLLPMLEGLRMQLSEVKLADILGFEDLAQRISTSWGRDLNRAQILRSLAGMTPIRSITNIVSVGVNDLLGQPVAQLRRKDGRVSKGIIKGLNSFFSTLVIEGLALADLCVSGAQTALSTAENSLATPATQPDAGPAVELVWDENDEWTEVERGATSHRPYMPSSALEGIELGTRALLRGIFSGLDGVQQSAQQQQTVMSVARGLPLFVLRPAIGATQALAVAVGSARRAVDAPGQKEISRRYKAPYAVGSNLTPPR